jgi:hypothetical protein
MVFSPYCWKRFAASADLSRPLQRQWSDGLSCLLVVVFGRALQEGYQTHIIAPYLLLKDDFFYRGFVDKQY